MSDETQTMTEEVYTFICAYMEEHGFAPSQREIAQGCYRSRPIIVRHLDRLEWQGRITRDPVSARSIRLVEDS